MLTIFALFVTVISAKFELPKFAQLMVGPDVDTSIDYDKALKELKKHKEEMCREDSKLLDDSEIWYQYCIAMYDAMNEVRGTSDGNDINNQLSKFSKVNEFLYIIGSWNSEVDLSKLKAEMVVQIYYENSDDDWDYERSNIKTIKKNKYINKNNRRIYNLIHSMVKTHFDGSRKSSLRLAHEFGRKPRSNEENSAFSLVGNIKDKVSFLILIGCNVKITGSDLNVGNVAFLQYSQIDSESKKITSSIMQADILSMHYINNIIKNYEIIKVNQFTLDAFYYSGSNFQIIYAQDSWQIKYGSGSTASMNYLYIQDFHTGRSSRFSLPYSTCSVFNLMVYSYNYDINLDESTTLDDVFKSINITTISGFSQGPGGEMAKKLDEDDGQIEITTSGDWKSVAEEKRPHVTLTYDSEEFKYTEPQEKGPLEVKQEKPYIYKPQKRKNVNVGMIVGIVVAVVVVIVVVVVVVIIVIRKKKNAQQSNSEGEGGNQDE